jgi:putative beta-barrel porin BBP2
MLTTVGYFGSGVFQLGPNWALTAAGRRATTDHSLDALSSVNSRSNQGAFGTLYSISAVDTIELQYKFLDGSYANQANLPASQQQSFHDNTTQVLVHYEPSDKTLLLGNIGYLRRGFTHEQLNPYSGNVWHVSFTWDPGAHTQILVAAGRDLKSYVDRASEYFVDNEAGIDVSWKPRDALALSLLVAWQDENYIANAGAAQNVFLRKDKLHDQKITLTSLPRSWLSIEASIALEQRQSNYTSFSFDDKLASIGFKVSF